jgi:hypothetical protein
MPRYLVEQTFPDTIEFLAGNDRAKVFQAIIATNMDDGVTWIHSYVSTDMRKAFCIVDGPSPEAIRRAAKMNKLPVDKITEVNVLDPYFYK